jgi:hypothetical protein
MDGHELAKKIGYVLVFRNVILFTKTEDPVVAGVSAISSRVKG